MWAELHTRALLTHASLREEPPEPAAWLALLRRGEAFMRPRELHHHIMETIELAIMRGELSWCDGVCAQLADDPLDRRWAIKITLGVLTITLGVRDKLPSRARLWQHAHEVISASRSPEDAEVVFGGLR